MHWEYGKTVGLQTGGMASRQFRYILELWQACSWVTDWEYGKLALGYRLMVWQAGNWDTGLDCGKLTVGLQSGAGQADSGAADCE